MKTTLDLTNKPYYKCFTCHRFRNTCGGRPTRDMNLKEWCEYIRDIKDYFRLTNAYITEKAEASAKTTERIMTINTDQDIMRATARRYEQAVIGPVGDFTCYNDRTTNNEIAALQSEIATLRDQIAYLHKEDQRKAKIIDKLLAE